MKLHEVASMPISGTFKKIFESKESWIVSAYGPALEAAAKKLGERVTDAASIVTALKAADPNRGKYLTFLAKMYAANQFRLEDVSRLGETLREFELAKRKLPNKDIMSYPTLRDLYQAIESVADVDEVASKRAQVRDVKHTGAETVIDTPHFKVIIPKTKEAACLYGRGTKWCTAATSSDNHFETYNKQGPLYVLIVNDNGKERKFQFHYESDQFMDETDSQVEKKDINMLSAIPEYKDFLEMQIRKHYGI